MDNNWFYNSIQAQYIANIVQNTAKQRMSVIAGQSVSDISAVIAKSMLERILDYCKSLKLLSSSDDATRGYKNVTVSLTEGAMVCGAELKLGTGIYFVPITFLVSPVTQTA
jgi:hypothetical protein